MLYIVRYKGRREKMPRHWTVPPEGAEIQFKRRHKRVGLSGLGPVVEDIGPDRSTITLRARSQQAKNARGLASSIGWLTFRLLERHQSIRVLSLDAEVKLRTIDQQIAEKEAELKEIRDQRRDFVREAWKSGDRLNINELEEKAQT